ncbi:hypothetical protein JMG10_14450 [Nostoc ellipsosporum NOK]|nr:hypothetical protein [Nostoc ellipsosporum NOK]
MRLLILVLLVSVIVSSCAERNSFNHASVREISELSQMGLPPPILNSLPVYVSCSNDSIAESGFINLLNIYEALYSQEYGSFSDFLFDVINQKILLNPRDNKTEGYYRQVFKQDAEVRKLYEQKGIKGLIEQYCIQEGMTYKLKKIDISIIQLSTISYYFFRNKLMRVDDDYRATTIFRPLNSLMSTL